MKLKITIEMDNAAFVQDALAGTEAARILRELADDLNDCSLAPGCGPNGQPWQLRDVNGNRVGEAKVTR